MCDLLWKCCKNIVDVTTFFFLLFHRFCNTHFFFPIFGNAIATIAKNLYHLLRQWHCHNCQFFFFPTSFGFPCAHSHFEHPPEQQEWAEGIAAIPLPKIKNFSILLFIYLSPNFVEFRQWYCRNSLSFLRLLNNLKQYL